MATIQKQWLCVEARALATELKIYLRVSHRQAKGFLDGHCVKVAGKVISKHGHRITAGDHIEVSYDPERSYAVIPPKSKIQAIPYETLFEDKHLLFINKDAGMLTVPSEKPNEPSLADQITDHYRRRGFTRFELFIVHRLDRFTSGVLVFAKTAEALFALKKIFNLHRLQRIYKAILVGELPENQGTLRDHLIEQVKTLKMKVVTSKAQTQGAKEAITHYRVIERLPGHTVLELRLETGRRNQIRVQFANRGFALLGDQVYGQPSDLLDRQALHAEVLGFLHPITQTQVTVTAKIPRDMNQALEHLRNERRLQRAQSGITGEEGIFHPKITKEQKTKRVQRMKKFNERSFASSDRTPRSPSRVTGAGRPRKSSGPRKSSSGKSDSSSRFSRFKKK